MTNAQIILEESQELAEQGIIEYTGNTVEYEVVGGENDGMVIEYKETEPIHTFATWKKLGYQVQKGEKAIAEFMVWKMCKPSKKQVEEAKKNDEEAKSKMIKKMAYFFKSSQVQKIEEE